MEKIFVSLVCDLVVQNHQHCRWISAASGLVKKGENIFVIADDRQELALFNLSAPGLAELITFDSTPLSEAKAERKAQKNDWESLLTIVIDGQETLLAVPSGSTDLRNTAVIADLSIVDGSVNVSKVRKISCKGLFEELKKRIEDLNIEGATICGKKFLLFQRGNGIAGVNAVIAFNADEFAAELRKGELSANLKFDIHHINLGHLNGCRLGFTDAFCDVEGELWYLAAAERADSTYLDGEFSGAVVGRLASDYSVTAQKELAILHKPEGLAVEIQNGRRKFFIVTDSDDESSPAKLYSFYF